MAQLRGKRLNWKHQDANGAPPADELRKIEELAYNDAKAAQRSIGVVVPDPAEEMDPRKRAAYERALNATGLTHMVGQYMPASQVEQVFAQMREVSQQLAPEGPALACQDAKAATAAYKAKRRQVAARVEKMRRKQEEQKLQQAQLLQFRLICAEGNATIEELAKKAQATTAVPFACCCAGANGAGHVKAAITHWRLGAGPYIQEEQAKRDAKLIAELEPKQTPKVSKSRERRLDNERLGNKGSGTRGWNKRLGNKRLGNERLGNERLGHRGSGTRGSCSRGCKAEDASLCLLCMEEERQICFVPCGHVLVCVRCSQGWMTALSVG